ncbi:MAG: FAD-binding oxidoreductase [Pseudomonadota bacterium]
MTFESWGRYPFTDQQGGYVVSRHDVLPQHDQTFLPYGNGRSYGDSCLNKDGLVLSTKQLKRFIAFDPELGILRCESGVLLKTILQTFVPKGWFLPVVPGTQYVTVGGAIANDVHGKNHHRNGTFGHFVVAFELLRSDGQRLTCSPTENTDYFYASIAGLGLTGLITWADIQLQPVKSSSMLQETIKYHSLDDFFELSEASEHTYDYNVAWLDCLASGRQLGRGHFTRANHSDQSSKASDHPNRVLSVPFSPPISLVNKVTLKLFNSLYFHRQRASRRHSQVQYESLLLPLDCLKKLKNR